MSCIVMAPLQDQCALDANGKLQDASEIVFYQSETDETPIAAPAAVVEGKVAFYLASAMIDHCYCYIAGNAARRTSQRRVKGQRLQEFVNADKLNDEGRLEKKYQNPTLTRASKRAKTVATKSIDTQGYESGADDTDFHAQESTPSESDGDLEEISNAEVRFVCSLSI